MPVPVAHTLSYQSPTQLLWAKEAGLQNDLAKVVRYCKKLPDKEQSLVKVKWPFFCAARLVRAVKYVPDFVRAFNFLMLAFLMAV